MARRSAGDVFLDVGEGIDFFIVVVEQDVVRITFGDSAVESAVSGKELAHFGFQESFLLLAEGVVVSEAIEGRLTGPGRQVAGVVWMRREERVGSAGSSRAGTTSSSDSVS